jgi:predicted transcriptional regulator
MEEATWRRQGHFIAYADLFDIIRRMTKIIREAIEALRDLPEERQETIARAILDYASHDDGVYHLTDVERAEVRAGLAEIERGEIASDDEVRAVYERIGV